MDFLIRNKWYILTVVMALVLAVVSSVLLFGNSEENIDYEKRDKRLISNLLITAVDGGSIEKTDNYYNGMVEQGFLDKKVKDEYFDFNQMGINTFWGRYDIGANKEISIRLNEQISKSDSGDKNYLTVVSYRYPIEEESLGHDYSGDNVGGSLYYRVNKVIVSSINDEGRVIGLTSFPESSIVSDLDDVGLEMEDKHLFDEGMVPVEEDYINDIINGKIHEHDSNSNDNGGD